MEADGLVLYRGCTPVVDATYSVESDRSPTEAIIRAVAKAADVNPLESAPLYEYVDPDAVNNLFRHSDAEQAETLLSFEIETWNVFVRADGKIRVCDGTQPTTPEPIFG